MSFKTIHPTLRNSQKFLVACKKSNELIVFVSRKFSWERCFTTPATEPIGLAIQEKTPSLGKPLLVKRDTTEHPEAAEAGSVRLVGTDADEIVGQAGLMLNNIEACEAMAFAHNP